MRFRSSALVLVLVATGCSSAPSRSHVAAGRPSPASRASILAKKLRFADATGCSGWSPVAASWLSTSKGWLAVTKTCHSRNEDTHRSRLFLTRDAGQSWHRVEVPAAVASEGIQAVAFGSSGSGVVIGRSSWQTGDAGGSWTKVKPEDTEAAALSDRVVSRIAFRGDGCPGPCHATMQIEVPGATRWQTIYRNASGDSNALVASGSVVVLEMLGNPAGAGYAHTSLLVSLDDGRTVDVRGDPCGSAVGVSESDAAVVAIDPDQMATECVRRHRGGRDFVLVSHDNGETFPNRLPIPRSVLDQTMGLSGAGLVFAGTNQDLGQWTTTIATHTSVDGWRTRAVVRSRANTADLDLAPQLACAGRGCVLVGLPGGPYVSTDRGASWHARPT